MSIPEPVVLQPSTVPVDYVKEGTDWLAVFNPNVQRVMDVKLHSCIPCNKVIGSVRFSPEGSRVAIGYDGGVVVCDLDGASKVLLSLSGEQSGKQVNYVRSVVFSPDRTMVAAASEDKLIRVWSLSSHELLHTLSDHTREIYALDFTPNGQLLSVSADRTIRVWTLSSSPATNTILSVEEDYAKSGTSITALSISPEGLHAAVGTSAGNIRIWDLMAPAPVAEWAGHGDQIYSIRWTRVGLVSGGLDKTMKWWDLELSDGLKTRATRTMSHTNYVSSTASVQHGLMKRAATGTVDGKLQMWDLKTGELLFCVMGHRNSVTAVDLSPEGTYAISGSGDGDARIWSYTVM